MPGDQLAVIQWADNSLDPLLAPADCDGEIASVNRNIVFENLEFEPAEWLLILNA